MMSDVDGQERHIVDFWGKAKSIVWNIFGFYYYTETGTIDKTRAVCKLCYRTYSYNGNTTNLAGHMKRGHPEIYEQSTQDGCSPTSILPQMESYEWQEDRKLLVDTALVNYIISSMAPIETVAQPHFQAFVSELQPKYSLPSASEITLQLQEQHGNQKDMIQHELHSLRNISLTYNSWMAMNSDLYATTRCHYITADCTDRWMIRSHVLQTSPIEGSPDHDKIVSYLKAVKSCWNLPEIVAVAEDLKPSHTLGWEHIGCVGHTIKYLVKNIILEDLNIKPLVIKARCLVSSCQMNSIATIYLMEKQKLFCEHEVSRPLVLDDPNTWTTLIDMLERISEFSPALYALCNDTNMKVEEIKVHMYSFVEQKVVDGLLGILKPLKIAVGLLSNQDSPTLPLVIPTLTKLQQTLHTDSIDKADTENEIENSERQTRNLKHRVKSALMTRIDLDLACYELASALDPRTKAVISSQKQDIKERLMLAASNQIVDIVPPQVKSEQQPDISTFANISSSQILGQVCPLKVKKESGIDHYYQDAPPTKKPKLESDESWLDDILNVKVHQIDALKTVRREVDSYFSDSYEKGESAMTWWASRASTYPHVAALAKKYLAVPALSVSAEQVFSLLDNYQTETSGVLKPEHVDMMVFLKHNCQ